ncbi:MAG: NfeD family protein [Candidatus Brocadiia bacterium]
MALLALMGGLALAARPLGAAAPRRACILPLRGRLDALALESLHQRLREAAADIAPARGDDEEEAPPSQPGLLVVLDLGLEGGSLGHSLDAADTVHGLYEKGIETAALVREPGSAPGTLLAIACEKLFMAPSARLVPLDPQAFDEPGPQAAEQLLAAADRYSARRPRLRLFYRALVDPAVEAYAVLFEGRPDQPGFYTPAEHKRLVAKPPRPIDRSERLVKPGSRPALEAAKARDLGLAAEVAENPHQVVQHLGVAGSDVRLLEGEPQGAKQAAEPQEPEEGQPAAKPRIKPIGSGPKVVFIPLDGMVGEGMRHSVERRLAEAKELEPALIVFEMDTYGGLLASALEIADAIFDLERPRTVALVNDKAISAGSLISVACDQIVMSQSSEIGDCQVVTTSGEAVRSEKIDTVLRARFRTFCEGKYPIALAEAMVTQEFEVYQVTTRDGETQYLKGSEWENMTAVERQRYVAGSAKLILDSSTLLTMTDDEAREYGFSSATVSSRQELLDHFGLADREVVVLDWNWSERFVRWLDRAGPLLLMLGVLGILIELKTPGFGIPGILGLALVAVFFLGKHTAGLAEAWEILLFAIGVGLLAIELFVTPGFGVFGILGLLAMGASLLLALQPFVIPESPVDQRMFERNLMKLGAVALGVFVGAIVIGRYLHRAPYLSKIVLATPSSSEPTSVSSSVSPAPSAQQEEQRATALVGKRGRAATMLRPAGRAEFDGEPLDVVTEGEYIQPGEPIEIFSVRGNRVVVKRVT